MSHLHLLKPTRLAHFFNQLEHYPRLSLTHLPASLKILSSSHHLPFLLRIHAQVEEVHFSNRLVLWMFQSLLHQAIPLNHRYLRLFRENTNVQLPQMDHLHFFNQLAPWTIQCPLIILKRCQTLQHHYSQRLQRCKARQSGKTL